eukprot:TRINITY_DN12185_c0_g9_i1.p1 TRINITY_DN12185_c0_g9~~TRINITY_DN12185_c0_g9_i1.p1  ORF type:complete len:351 (+),score=56.76 TRINITY_DN12185_c0_g9_i1:174-1226(+)
METTCLPLPPTIRTKLLAAGYKTTLDFQGVSPVELAKDAYLTNDEALHVLNSISFRDSTRKQSHGVAGAKSAWELLEKEKARKKITTLCPEIDAILGGGIAPRELTEICGVPGIGKTQFGIQLAMNVQIPFQLEGLNGHAVYIDTEGSFMVERALEMAVGMIDDVKHLAAVSHRPDVERLMTLITPDEILSRIHYYRVHDYTEQIAVINLLEEFLENHRDVKLIIIDSVTFHFRQDFSDMALRTRLLAGMAQKLMAIADEHDIAIVLVNQVTTKVTGESSKLIPALGESWSHACTNRVVLFWADGERRAYIYKSPSLKNESARYNVTQSGIRSLPARRKRAREEDDESER